VNRTGAWNVIPTPRFVPLVITRFILSSAVGAGEFGRYARFTLDEERSLGQPMVATTFTDPTSVFSYERLRLLKNKRADAWNYRYLHALLENQSGISFDYPMKAHPSVIRS
jgi:hypothetical protein